MRRLILPGVLLIGASASIYALAFSQHGRDEKRVADAAQAAPAPEAHNFASPFAEFPAESEAEKELEAMLAGPEDKIDLALANWLVIADLPPYKDLTRDQYFAMLDETTNRVRGMIEQARRNPLMAGDLNDPARLAHVFCSAMIALGIDYVDEFKVYTEGPGDALPLYRDADNVFIAGLLKTRKGSCVSMPMLYLVVGKRLGLPVHLVNVGQHTFIRWEQPGYRMNIETTIVKKVAMTPDEDNFLEVEHLTREELEGTNDLKNMSNRSVIASLLHARCGWYMAHGPQYRREFWRDLNRAHLIAPKDRIIALNYQRATQSLETNQREHVQLPVPRPNPMGRTQPWVPNPQPPALNVPNPRPPSPFGY